MYHQIEWENFLDELQDHAIKNREKTAEYQVTDLSDDRIVLAGEVKIPANSACVADSVPNSMSKHTVYLIEWKCGGATYKNHYLTGKPPYDLDTYIRMMEKVEEK